MWSESPRSLKLIAQRSVRRNSTSHEILEDFKGKEASKEVLKSYELMYSESLGAQVDLKVNGFFNDAQVIAWDSDRETTVFVGDLKTAGFELELGRQGEFFSWSLSYSFSKQVSFDLSSGLDKSGITYSDYRQEVGDFGAVIMGEGNDLNNWPNQSFKWIVNQSLSQSVALHFNGQLFWDQQGPKDGLIALERAVAGSPDEAATMAEIEKIREEDVYDMIFRSNLGLSVDLREKTRASIVFRNVFDSSRAHRFSYDTSTSKPSPHNVRFVHEELSVSFLLDVAW